MRSLVLKKSLKLFLLISCAALCLVLMATSAFAVPSATGEPGTCRSHTGKLLTLDSLPAPRSAGYSKKAYVPALEHTTRNIPLLTIVVGFPNMPYDDTYDWNETFFSGERSITAYYSDMSLGKFTFVPAKETAAYDGSAITNRADKANDGVIHVTLSTNHIDWSTNYAKTNPKKDKEQYRQLTLAMKAAIEKAGEYIDFASYDLDGNGVIESSELALGFVVAGYEGAYVEALEDSDLDKSLLLWAHAYTITDMISDYQFDFDPPKPDGVVVSDYIAVAENLMPGLPQPISTLAHELGHYLGLPDLYDTEYMTNAQWSDYTVHVTSIMCSAWGTDLESGEEEAYVPYSMDPWCRYKLGWVEPVVADATGDYTVSGQTYTKKDAYQVVLIPTQKSQEYYLAENRQLTKWDAGMTVDYEGASLIGGVILWHVDDAAYDLYHEYNAVNNTVHRPAVMPLFPESLNDKTVFTGGNGSVYVGNPFYDRTFCIDKLGLEDAVINLPLYGTGSFADLRSGRWNSGITVKFLDDSAPTMTLHVDQGDRAELKDENECMYCHRVHTGFFGNIVAFFHRLFFVIRSFFGK